MAAFSGPTDPAAADPFAAAAAPAPASVTPAVAAAPRAAPTPQPPVPAETPPPAAAFTPFNPDELPPAPAWDAGPDPAAPAETAPAAPQPRPAALGAAAEKETTDEGRRLALPPADGRGPVRAVAGLGRSSPEPAREPRSSVSAVTRITRRAAGVVPSVRTAALPHGSGSRTTQTVHAPPQWRRNKSAYKSRPARSWSWAMNSAAVWACAMEPGPRTISRDSPPPPLPRGAAKTPPSVP